MRLAFVDFQKLAATGDEGALVARIAVAVNNLKSGEYLLSTIRPLRVGAATASFGRALGMYVVGMEIGHLHEAFLLVDNPNNRGSSIAGSSNLLNRIAMLSPESVRDHELIKTTLDDPTERDLFNRYVERFRNRIAFHHDHGYRGHGKPTETPVTTEALSRLASRGKIGPVNVQLRSDLEQRFDFADVILDTAVCRSVWQIDEQYTGVALQTESDKVIDWIGERAKAFVGFASELCMNYIADKLV
jgi:hypothetical protein